VTLESSDQGGGNAGLASERRAPKPTLKGDSAPRRTVYPSGTFQYIWYRALPALLTNHLHSSLRSFARLSRSHSRVTRTSGQRSVFVACMGVLTSPSLVLKMSRSLPKTASSADAAQVGRCGGRPPRPNSGQHEPRHTAKSRVSVLATQVGETRPEASAVAHASILRTVLYGIHEQHS
jgi:hypothetical protein